MAKKKKVEQTPIAQDIVKADLKISERPPQKPIVPLGVPDVIRNEKGGVTAVVSPEGEVFPEIAPSQREAMYNVWAKQTTPLAGEAQLRKTEQKTAQEMQVKKAQQQIVQEQNPELRSLAPIDVKGQNLPVIGGTLGAVVTSDLTLAARAGKMKGINPEQIPSPERLRTAALTQIEAEVYAEAQTQNERFGMVIEGIPIVGSLVSKYVRGLIQTPSGDVDTLMSTITQERIRATKYSSWAQQGIISPQAATANVEDIELNIQRLESRIKLLINYSPILRSDPEQVHKLEIQILRAKEQLLQTKLNIAAGVADLPSDEQLAMAMEDLE